MAASYQCELKKENQNTSLLSNFYIKVADDIAARELLLASRPDLSEEDKLLFNLFKKLAQEPSKENFKALCATQIKHPKEYFFYMARCRHYGFDPLSRVGGRPDFGLYYHVHLNSLDRDEWDTILNTRDSYLVKGMLEIGEKGKESVSGLEYIQKAALREAILTLHTTLPFKIVCQAQPILEVLIQGKFGVFSQETFEQIRNWYTNKNYKEVICFYSACGYDFTQIAKILNVPYGSKDPTQIQAYCYLYYLIAKKNLRAKKINHKLSNLAIHGPDEFTVLWHLEPSDMQTKLMAALNLDAKWSLFQYAKRIAWELHDVVIFLGIQDTNTIPIIFSYYAFVQIQDLEATFLDYLKSDKGEGLTSTKSSVFLKNQNQPSMPFFRSLFPSSVEEYIKHRDSIWSTRGCIDMASTGDFAYLDHRRIVFIAHLLIKQLEEFKEEHIDLNQVLTPQELMLFNNIYKIANKFINSEPTLPVPPLHELIIHVRSDMALIKNSELKQIWQNILIKLHDTVCHTNFIFLEEEEILHQLTRKGVSRS